MCLMNVPLGPFCVVLRPGKRPLVRGVPWELFGGSPRRCGSASVVQRPRGTGEPCDVRNSARGRVIGGGGGAVGWFCGRWGGGGGWMVLREGGGGRWFKKKKKKKKF